MNDFPRGWTQVPISEVLDHNDNGKPFQQGWSPQCHSYPAPEGAWGALRTTAIQQGQFWPHENKALPDHLEPRPHLEVRSGDILMTCAGPRSRCGVTCLVEQTPPRLMMSGKMYRFRPNREVMHPKYLMYFLLTYSTTLKIDRMKTGISDSGLNLTHDRFATLQVPVAPPNEQIRIISKIEELFSELDKGVEALNTARDQLKVYRHSLLQYAFAGKATVDLRKGHAPNWDTLPVSSLLSAPLCNGHSVKDRSGGFPVLRLNAFKSGRLDLEECKEGAWEREDALPFLVSVGDFFVARGNGSKHLVGIGGLVGEVLKEVAFPDTMIRLRLNSRIDPRYFALCWNSRIVRRQIERDARTTAGIYKINQDHISQFKLPVPPIEEQRLIVSSLEVKLSSTGHAIQQAEIEIGRSTALRQSILEQAFSGQLIVHDPKDESSSVLLERIRAERAGGAIKKPGPKTKKIKKEKETAV